jgi:hypothetical protein
MKIYTLDNIKRDINQGGLYDIFDTKISQKSYTKVFWYTVQPEEEMRMDLICKKFYGETDYIDEILTLNNIIDPFSITKGTNILLFELDDTITLYVQDVEVKQDLSLVNKNKETTKDPNRGDNKKLPGNMKKDVNYLDVNIDKDKVKIINELK